MLKRCFGVLLAICMLFTMAQPIMVAAADDGTLVVGSGTVNAGDAETVIPITIEKKGTVGATALQFDVVFPDALILTAKPTVGTLFADKGLHQEVFTSPYVISLGNDTATEDVTAEGVLVTLNFKVKEGTPAGEYNITIESQDNYNADVDNVVFGVTAGAITVGGTPAPADVTVTFDGNGGTPATTTATVKEGETVSKPATDPTRDGYDFTGWFQDKDGNTVFDFATKIQAATTIYAGWKEKAAPTPVDVTVTFDANGGTPATTTATVKEGETVSKPATDPTRDGFKFTGWFQDKDGNTAFDFATKIQAATTIYAGWEKAETPTASTEGLVVGTGTVQSGDADTVVDITIEKKGTVGATALQFDVVFPDALVLTAKPVVGTLFADKGLHQEVFTSPYTISLGNDTATEDVTAEGVLVTLKFKVKAGTADGTYNITIQGQDNYNASVDSVTFNVTPGSITVGSGGGTPTPADVTVTFDGNGGTPATTAKTVKAGETVAESAAPTVTRENYDFTGWFTDKNGANKFDFATKIQSATTIYAGWKQNTPSETTPSTPSTGGGGCYIATSVYGSYDTPEVWTLRRFRDDVLGQTWYGRLFIKAYYATSPTLVRLFGDAEWFQNFWRDKLDTLVQNLQDDGFEATPYQDKDW